MSVRQLRRTFASPFVITLAAIPAACMVQSAPPRAGNPNQMTPGPSVAQPQPTDPNGPPSDPNGMPQRPVEVGPTTPPPTVISNPPRPTGAVKATTESHWTVMKQGDKCQAFVKVSCPPNAMCNPPPPRAYACTPEITPTTPLKIVQYVGAEFCQVETAPMECPPNVMCNPPPPTRVACPQ
ncbi:MAG: hypothetical protein IPQ07_43270 [Myxococcales bacterium]|nr:hypothetical protein [Myxococcales bacterium]